MRFLVVTLIVAYASRFAARLLHESHPTASGVFYGIAFFAVVVAVFGSVLSLAVVMAEWRGGIGVSAPSRVVVAFNLMLAAGVVYFFAFALNVVAPRWLLGPYGGVVLAALFHGSTVIGIVSALACAAFAILDWRRGRARR